MYAESKRLCARSRSLRESPRPDSAGTVPCTRFDRVLYLPPLDVSLTRKMNVVLSYTYLPDLPA